MSTAGQIAPGALTAWHDLTARLIVLDDEGVMTPCAADPEAFIGEDRGDREHAAEVCRRTCPALDACARFADAQGETWGVWGGTDRTTYPSGRKATTSTTTTERTPA
ncbi:WhiB family transcriptional regulator [Nocardioidaceae bacterium]|nr:WhiB family transcriptional regulator [Nocardioidaceae bacterium]